MADDKSKKSSQKSDKNKGQPKNFLKLIYDKKITISGIGPGQKFVVPLIAQVVVNEKRVKEKLRRENNTPKSRP